MNIHITIQQQGVHVDETVSGATANEIVKQIKARVAQKLGFPLNMVVNGMSDLMFAQTVVKRYNEAERKALAMPASCDEFLRMAVEQGFARFE